MDGGAKPAPILTSLTPTQGPKAGGTEVTVNGTNFRDGAVVSFGSVHAATTFVSDRKLTATTPPALNPGAVSVTVTNDDGRSSTLNAAFTYTAATTTRTIAEAKVTNEDVTDTSGTATVSITVAAQVKVPTVTPGAGQGQGVRAQVGYSTSPSTTPASAEFSWVDASYVGDVDEGSGDAALDAYSGEVALPGATGGGQLVYFLSARFSIDDGQTWVLADRDGLANGVSSAALPRVTVGTASVGWCKLGGVAIEAPPSITLRGGEAGPVVYGQVYKQGVTDQPGVGAGVKGELGYGAMGSDPATWAWSPATYNTDTSGGSNDEFEATLPNPGPGTYRFAFRVSDDDGPWSYCDADGLDTNGFTQDQAGTLTVQTVGIDSCKVQFPDSLTTYEGRPAGNSYGRVFVQGVTEASGQGAGIEGQVGFGPSGSTPDGTWTWSANATFNVDDGMGGDEYQQALTGPAPGTYAYAWRFRLSGGAWTYCDRDGSQNGIDVAQLGALDARAFDVSSCVMETTNLSQTALPGATSQPWAVKVTVPTLTDGTGQGTPLTVELGYGAAGSDPSTWASWAAADFTNDDAAADRYAKALTAPTATGSYSVAFRVKVGARPAVYCDRDDVQNGYQAAQAGTLAVSNTFISSCQLGTPSAFSLQSGAALQSSASITIPGVSGAAGASPGLRVQFGIGPQGDNASSSALFGWIDGAYLAESAGADQFGVTTYPAYTGARATSARASLDDGGAWTYCDLDGADGGYTVDQQYDVTVTPHTDFEFCNTQFPGQAQVGGTIYGQVYKSGVTPSAGAPIIAQFGVGEETSDPGYGWSWSAAPFSSNPGGQPNNNEYAVTLGGSPGQRYAFRYTLDGGVWCYGDLDGSNTNGFTGGANLGLIAP